MKDKVAIIGSHPNSMNLFDFSRTDCDVWAFNEAVSSYYNPDLKNTGRYIPRADAIFQLHDPIIFRSVTNRNDPKHYEWLKSQTDATIYMQEKYEDVPKAEAYPMKEIMRKFRVARKYFTSSVAFAIALAIFKDYKFIEIYGVEMETNTEYAHQRPGVAYWTGFADAKGIIVDFHSGKFFDTPLYGFEGYVKIPVDHYKQRIDEMAVHVMNSREALEHNKHLIEELLGKFIESYKTDLTDLKNMCIVTGRSAQQNGAFEGAKGINQMYLEKITKMQEEFDGDYLFVRQEMESYMVAARKEIMTKANVANSAGNRLGAQAKKLDTTENREARKLLVSEFKSRLEQYISASFDLGEFQGIAEECMNMMRVHDHFETNAKVNQAITNGANVTLQQVEVQA